MNKIIKFSNIMKVFQRTKPLCTLLRELPIGETVIVDNRVSKIASVRKIVTALRKEGYEFKATEKGLINKIAVTKIHN